MLSMSMCLSYVLQSHLAYCGKVALGGEPKSMDERTACLDAGSVQKNCVLMNFLKTPKILKKGVSKAYIYPFTTKFRQI